MKILIVDDSNVIRRSISRAFGEDKHEIKTADNAANALAIFGEFNPDVVTMDITMPGDMDGLGCVDALIKIRPDVRILVISALGDKATGVEAVKRGAQGFLLKPITPEKVNEELTELLKDE